MAFQNAADYSANRLEPSDPVPTAQNLILIDNYDSFAWNVYQYLVLEGAKVDVYRNDQITLEELIAKNPTQLVVSPGPGHPSTDSGVSRDAIRHFAGKIPIFGVCMGQQCILDVYGGEVCFAGEILHGKTSPLAHDSKGIYAGVAQGTPIARYHSLAGTHLSLPECLDVTSWIANDDGEKGVIMGVRHKEYTMEAVQFHPESILSIDARIMIRNFLLMQGGTWAENERLQKLAKTGSEPNGVPPSTSSGKKNNILQQIYDRRRELVDAQRHVPGQRRSDLEAAYKLGAAPSQVPFVKRLRKKPFDIALMAEIKRASPSKGVFALEMDAPTQARKYALAGASVISVLTEPDWFKGSIEDLRAVRAVLDSMPNRPAILRKEFVFDEYQILEARLAGADTVLLIVKMLDEALLRQLYEYAQSLGMEPLVEVQNADEMTVAVRLGARVIGVNNRNLESFEVDLDTTGRLRGQVPAGTLLCALSGINSHDDVLVNQRQGVDAVLVGEAIMRAPDASQFIRTLLAGPAAVPPAPPSPSRPEPLLVKICGTRTPEAALAAADAGADLIGIILVPGRKRTVSDEAARRISDVVHAYSRPGAAEPASAIPAEADHTAVDYFALGASKLRDPRRPLLVGVFLDQPLAEVVSAQRRLGLDAVQLHGTEPPDEFAAALPCPVIRRFDPSSSPSFPEPGLVGGPRGRHALPLLDAGARGGAGKQLDPASVRAALAADPALRVLLAGGLAPDTVAAAVAALNGPDDECVAARVLGVDVSSGVEGPDGQQDLDRIRAFVAAAKAIR
ncbi:indole-3-glycerol phosphate synthase-domain-containing protein [Xylariaceae sp. FL0804]|nr:indole-3-glycerol phosphate synthase-domain-containing protein [Xylariaceae sp. FL0804]